MNQSVLYAELNKTVRRQLRDAQSRLGKIQAAMTLLSAGTPPPLTFEVRLTSLWEGEAGVVLRSSKDLATILRSAQAEFRKRNHRSDVQASYRILVYLGKGRRSTQHSFVLPTELYASLI